MPISHKLRAVFVHVPKAAGSSMQAALYSVDRHLEFIGPAPAHIVNTENEFWLHHLPAGYLREFLGTEIWSMYFKFAFVRNPYDLVVSYYFYHKRRAAESEEFRSCHPEIARRFANNCSFEEWILAGLYMKPQASYLADKTGTLLLDFIGRYEKLSEGFAAISDALQVKLILPHLRRTNHEHWEHYYNDHLRAIVHKHFCLDFSLFEYKS